MDNSSFYKVLKTFFESLILFDLEDEARGPKSPYIIPYMLSIQMMVGRNSLNISLYYHFQINLLTLRSKV